MKLSLYLVSLSLFFLMLGQSCKKDEGVDPDPDPKEDTTKTDTTDITPTKSNTEILSKKWIVDEAYVNQTIPDASSKGLTLDVRADGSYTLSTGYVGTWEFQEDETKILWDKGEAFQQLFALNKFEEELIDASFVSGFTGQNARWVMIPF